MVQIHLNPGNFKGGIVRPEKKDLEGMSNIFGRGSVDHMIGLGYNQACDDWERYLKQNEKEIT